MRYVLGVDGGGSQVVCLLANERGELLGYGRGGPVNTNYVLFQDALAALVQAARTALDAGGVRGDQVEAMVLSAAMEPSTLAEAVRRLGVRKAIKASEGETPRWAARFWIHQRIGVAVDAGTGSLARGWSRDGRECGAGGFGVTLGDEGSGLWIGMKAIIAVIQSQDGRLEDTRLAGSVLEYFNVNSIQDLGLREPGGFITTAKMMEKVKDRDQTRFVIDSGIVLDQASTAANPEQVKGNDNSRGGLFFQKGAPIEPMRRDQVAGLCPLVVEAARMGDAVAARILDEAGIELGRLAAAVIKRLGMQSEAFAIVPFGGVFKAGEPILAPFRTVCLAAAPRATVVRPRFEPAVGAVLIALDLIGTQIEASILRAVEQSARAFPQIGGIE